METMPTSPGQKSTPANDKSISKGEGRPPKFKKNKGKGKEADGESTGPAGNQASGNDDHEAWRWTCLTDSSLHSRAPVFTKDGRYFFSIVGSSVKIHSTSTGKVVSTLSPSASGSASSGPSVGQGHADLITAAILNPENSFQLLTASLDGCVKVWDFLDAVLIRTIDVGSPISHMCAHESWKGFVFVATLTSAKVGKKINANEEKGNTLILRVSLKSGKSEVRPGVFRSSEVVRIGKTRSAKALEVSPNGAWIVAIAACKAYVAMTGSLSAGFTKFVSPEKLTCLAFHPSEEYFATGDVLGQIRLWYCLSTDFMTKGGERTAQTTTMHWHAHAVSSIAFTTNGAYILSGGEESVLVIWQLHSGKKEFVPRVGAPIANVAVNSSSGSGEEYLLELADSSFVFIDAGSLSISRSIARITIDPFISHSRPQRSTSVPLAVHPTTFELILPSSHPSSLQTYSPSSSSLVSQLEVSPSNRISRRDETPIEPSRVELVSMCSSGEWMATVDRKEGTDEHTAQVFLKIWHWESPSWVLNTRIDRPHTHESIRTIAFSPVPVSNVGWLLVTAGADKTVKTWSTSTVKVSKGQTEDFWVNRSSFTHRTEIPADTSLSEDASVLAVAFGPHVILYDPQTNAQLDIFSSSEVRYVERVCFLGRSGRFLLVSNYKDAVLWDLTSRSIRWHHHDNDNIGHVLSHPEDNTVAIISHPYSHEDEQLTSYVSIFDSTSSNPRRTRSIPFRLRSIAWYPNAGSGFCLVGITQSWSIVLLGDNVDLPDEYGSTARPVQEGVEVAPRQTLFRDIFGDSAFDPVPTEFRKMLPTQRDLADTRNALSVFENPAYLTPDIASLYSTLMSGFLVERKADDEAPAERADELVEEAMDVDVEAESSASRPLHRRVVDDKEFEDLVGLFKEHAIYSTSTGGQAKQVNGINGSHRPTPNGIHHSRTSTNSPLPNGTARPSKTPKRHAVLSSPSLESSPTPVPSTPPVTTGKKRKKSMG